MKRVVGVLIVLTLMLSITGCNVRFGIRDKVSHSSELVNINQNISYKGESKIIIDINYGKINISNYDGDEVLITGQSNSSTNFINMTSDDNKIRIKDTRSNDINISLFGNNIGDNTNLEIKIPNNFNGDVEFSYGAGEATVNNIACNNLKIDGGAGQLNINDVKFNKFSFDGGVGQTNINLSQKSGEIDISGGVGEINVALTEIGGNLDCEGGVGSVKIRVPENAPVYFDTESGIGSVNVSAKTSGENLYKFSLEVGIGEIKVYN